MTKEFEEIGPTNEPSEVAFQLLADWWMDSIQALVDAVGSSKALELLRPHYKNAGISASLVIKNSFGLSGPDNRESWAIIQKMGYDFLTRADPSVFNLDSRDIGGTARSTDCPFKNGPLELCKLVCDTFPNTTLAGYTPDYEIVTTARISQGDPECVWITKPRSWELPVDIERLGNIKCETIRRRFPKEIVDDFSIQYLAEMWVISIRAYLEQFGNEKPASILRTYMKLSGTSFGLRHLRANPNAFKNNIAGGCVGLCYDALHTKMAQAEITKSNFERTIVECPFQDAPQEVCMQIASFCEGICESIDPDYQFAYDRMMTKGDGSCHWTIKKKEEQKAPDDRHPTDHLDRLIRKFIDGEITEDEFKNKMAVLKEMEIIKK